MTRCTICGTRIKPWFEVCHGCYTPISRDGKTPEPIVAKEFMQKMGIDKW